VGASEGGTLSDTAEANAQTLFKGKPMLRERYKVEHPCTPEKLKSREDYRKTKASKPISSEWGEFGRELDSGRKHRGGLLEPSGGRRVPFAETPG